MIAINDYYYLVDLTTLDKGLAEIMITDYPGRITGEQYHIDRSNHYTIHRFLYLQKQTLLGFLEDYGDSFEYEVRRSWDDKPIAINQI